MKILIASFPALGHFLPVVPLAWAARAAGHEVLVVTAGEAVGASERAGLPWADASPGIQMRAVAERSKEDSLEQFQNPMASEKGLAQTARFMAAVSDLMADRTIRAARAWKPDIIVRTPLEAAGLLAAELLSIPIVTHGFGITSIGKTGLLELIGEAMGPACERNGFKGDLAWPAALIDPCPPSLREPDRPDAWFVRYVPYNGGGELPDWMMVPPPQPRICVTLGTVVPHFGGVGGLRGVIEAVRDMEAEVILALGGADPSVLGPLPPNVRTVGWTPLSTLLPVCSAVVHHGGSGSTMNAVAAGIPQLALPFGADQHLNAAAIKQRGIGLTFLPEQADAQNMRHSLKRLLEDPGFTRAAQELKQENETQMPPSGLIPRLSELAGRA